MCAARIELSRHPLIRNMESEDLVTEKILSRRQGRRYDNVPFGPLFAKKIRRPGWLGARVVTQLRDLHPNIALVAFEGLAVVIGAMRKITIRFCQQVRDTLRPGLSLIGSLLHYWPTMRASPLVPLHRATPFYVSVSEVKAHIQTWEYKHFIACLELDCSFGRNVASSAASNNQLVLVLTTTVPHG